MRRIIPFGAVLVAGILVAGCSGSSATQSPAPTTAPSAAPSAEPSASSGGGGGAEAVTIKGFAFAPAALSVKVGTTVTWTNQDSATHTVTFDVGSDASGDLGNGGTYSETFATAGTFSYHCAIHSSMKATVTVTP